MHNASFPPLWYFVSFVCYEAKAKNDPSFTIACLPKGEEIFSKQSHQRMPISVHNIDVSQKAYPSKDTSDESSKNSPIHKKLHPLRKCCGFRMKPLEVRKAYLNENGICFRCCASSSHIACNCKTVVKCTECDSENHATTLHPGPAPWVCKNPCFSFLFRAWRRGRMFTISCEQCLYQNMWGRFASQILFQDMLS